MATYVSRIGLLARKSIAKKLQKNDAGLYKANHLVSISYITL